MKKKHDPKSVILTIILIITYALSVVFNFSHMMDGKGSRKPGFATAGLFLLAAFVYIVFKRMDKSERCSGRFRSCAPPMR